MASTSSHTPFAQEEGFEGAARALCSSQFVENEQGGGSWVTTDASFMRLDASNCMRQEHDEHAGCFESHTTLELPDNPPIKHCPEPLRHTDIHRFVLTDAVAAAINGPLHAQALQHCEGLAGSSRSNVGGYHSVEELWTGGGSSSEWYGRLHNVFLEAVRALNESADSERLAGVADLHVSGWFNVSAQRAFNTLHDHGDAPC